MFILWGIGRRKTGTKYLVEDTCDNCRTSGNMNIFKTYGCFTLFFIPIIKANTKYFAECPHCGAVKQLEHHEFNLIKDAYYNGQIHKSINQNVVVINDTQSNNLNKLNNSISNQEKMEIIAEIDTLVKKFKELNYEINKSNVANFKVALKRKLQEKYTNDKIIDEAIFQVVN